MSDDVLRAWRPPSGRGEQRCGRSYTRQLLDSGLERCGRKLGEEAVETIIAALNQDRGALTREAADLVSICWSCSSRAILPGGGCSGAGKPLGDLGTGREGGKGSSEQQMTVVALRQEMANRSTLQFSPYREFTREEWARLRADTPMTLVERDLEQLSGLMHDLSMEEVEQIYLPLSRLLNLHVAAAQERMR